MGLGDLSLDSENELQSSGLLFLSFPLFTATALYPHQPLPYIVYRTDDEKIQSDGESKSFLYILSHVISTRRILMHDEMSINAISVVIFFLPFNHTKL